MNSIMITSFKKKKKRISELAFFFNYRLYVNDLSILNYVLSVLYVIGDLISCALIDDCIIQYSFIHTKKVKTRIEFHFLLFFFLLNKK